LGRTVLEAAVLPARDGGVLPDTDKAPIPVLGLDIALAGSTWLWYIAALYCRLQGHQQDVRDYIAIGSVTEQQSARQNNDELQPCQ
jgi:hypothetical protein